MVPYALALRFLLELNAVAAVAIWGFRAGNGGVGGLAYAAAAVLVLIVNWTWFIAPRAQRSPIPLRWRTLAGAVVMLVAAVLLAVAGEPVPAAILAAAVIVDTIVLYATGAAGQEWPGAPMTPAAARPAGKGRPADRAGRAPAANGGSRRPEAAGRKRSRRRM
jgi:hypothetical protein